MHVREDLIHAWSRLSLMLADRRRQRRLLLAYCGAVILAYVLSVGLTVQAGVLPWARGDFTVYYTGARILRDGHAHRLYDGALQSQVQQEILRPYGFAFEGDLLPYNYPPFLATALIPLTFLSLRSAFLLWSLLNVGLIVASAALPVDFAHPRSRGTWAMTSLLALAFFPVLEGLIKGQVVFVVLFGLALSYWALQKDRGYLTGAALALGLVKPHLVGLVIVYLLYRRRWRAAAGFGVTSAALVIPSAALVGLRGLREYGVMLSQQSGWDEVAHIRPAIMANVRGTVYRAGLLLQQWFGTEPSEVTLTAGMGLLSLTVMALVFYAWRWFARGEGKGAALPYALTLTAGLLISPHLYNHDLSLLVLVGWLVFIYATASGRIGSGRWIIAVGHLAPLMLPAVLPAPLDSQVVAFLMLALVVVLVRWAVHDTLRQSTLLS